MWGKWGNKTAVAVARMLGVLGRRRARVACVLPTLHVLARTPPYPKEAARAPTRLGLICSMHGPRSHHPHQQAVEAGATRRANAAAAGPRNNGVAFPAARENDYPDYVNDRQVTTAPNACRRGYRNAALMGSRPAVPLRPRHVSPHNAACVSARAADGPASCPPRPQLVLESSRDGSKLPTGVCSIWRPGIWTWPQVASLTGLDRFNCGTCLWDTLWEVPSVLFICFVYLSFFSIFA